MSSCRSSNRHSGNKVCCGDRCRKQRQGGAGWTWEEVGGSASNNYKYRISRRSIQKSGNKMRPRNAIHFAHRARPYRVPLRSSTRRQVLISVTGALRVRRGHCSSSPCQCGNDDGATHHTWPTTPVWCSSTPRRDTRSNTSHLALCHRHGGRTSPRCNRGNAILEPRGHRPRVIGHCADAAECCLKSKSIASS